MKKQEFLLSNFSNIQDMIKFFEQKSNVLLIVYSIIFTTYFNNVTKLKYISFRESQSFFYKLKAILIFLLSIAIMGLLIYQLYILIFHILKPRNAKHYTKSGGSLFYYNHISQLEKETFINKIEESDNEFLDRELIEQIYEISKIATEKQNNYNKLPKFLFPTLVFLIFFIVLICL